MFRKAWGFSNYTNLIFIKIKIIVFYQLLKLYIPNYYYVTEVWIYKLINTFLSILDKLKTVLGIVWFTNNCIFVIGKLSA